jgi:hypothetical protein
MPVAAQRFIKPVGPGIARRVPAVVVGGAYASNAVRFDGSADYLLRGADLTGNADAKQCTGSLWFNRQATGGQWVYNLGPSGGYGISFAGSAPNDCLRVEFKNAGGTMIVKLETVETFTGTGAWRHAMFSFDLADTAKRHLYIDDASDLNVVTYTNDTMDFTRTEHAIGAGTSGVAKMNCEVADAWLDFGTYIDLSVAANRRKFIDASGKPVDLGSDGSTPTGSPPSIFLTNPLATWHTNAGSGGGFTENGALTAATSSPSD